MAWIKRNLFFVIGGILALGLLGAAGYYNYKGWSHNSAAFDKLNQIYGTLRNLTGKKPSPGNDKVDNIAAAREQERQIRDWIRQAAGLFSADCADSQHGHQCRFERSSSPRRSAGPSTSCNMKPRPPA